MKEMLGRVKPWLLSAAEVFDAWRIIPRVFLLCYGIMVYQLYTWVKSLPTTEKVECNAEVVEALIKNNVDPVLINELACRTVEIVGGPTTAQASFAGAIIGLSTAIFAFYANTGRKWNKTNNSE